MLVEFGPIFSPMATRQGGRHGRISCRPLLPQRLCCFRLVFFFDSVLAACRVFWERKTRGRLYVGRGFTQRCAVRFCGSDGPRGFEPAGLWRPDVGLGGVPSCSFDQTSTKHLNWWTADIANDDGASVTHTPSGQQAASSLSSRGKPPLRVVAISACSGVRVFFAGV